MRERKLLYLVRHAEAEGHGALTDFARRLTANGLREANIMGKRLLDNTVKIDLVVTSTAARALQTAHTIASNLELPKNALVENKAIYDSNPRKLLEIINATDDKVHSLMLVGHNPSISMMIAYLSQYMLESMPTCGIACISIIPERWAYLAMGTGEFEWFDFPENPNSAKIFSQLAQN